MTNKAAIKVMCIEDEANLRSNLVEILRSEGYNVRDFCDGLEALDFLQNLGGNLPDIIVVDINMPQINGLEFVRRMKALGSHFQNIPVIVLTAMSHDQYKSKADTLNIADYLVKPVDYDLLLEKIVSCTSEA